MNRKKIIVTGGAGFIGSCLVSKLLENRDYEVLNIDKLTYASNFELIKNFENYRNYQFSKLDICDQEALRELILAFQPDWVFHLAAESHVDNSIVGPGEFIKTNVLGTYSILEACRSHLDTLDNRKKAEFRFIAVSTDEVFGDLNIDEPAFTEESRYVPSSPYSSSKAAADHLVRAWGRTYDLPVVVTNCSNNYGPNQFSEKLIPHMITNAIKGETLPIYGDGKQIRDWLHVQDHVDALIVVANKGVPGQSYNIGASTELSNFYIVSKICKLLDEMIDPQVYGLSTFSELIRHVSDRPGHDRRYAINSSKIRDELGWKSKIEFEQGLYTTVAWYVKKVTAEMAQVQGRLS